MKQRSSKPHKITAYITHFKKAMNVVVISYGITHESWQTARYLNVEAIIPILTHWGKVLILNVVSSVESVV